MFEWFTANGDHIFWSDITNTIAYVVRHDPEHHIVVGSDSQPSRDKTLFVVAICIVSNVPQKERTYYYGKHSAHKIPNLYTRVYQEADGATNVALALKESHSILNDSMNISIHLDLSPPGTNKSTSKYCKGLTAFVKSCGFLNVETKPDSWASSSIADRYTKNDNSRNCKQLKKTN